MAFDLFGPETPCDIKVGYISTDRGLVEGVSLYEANHHAKLNPGTQFIFRNRDKVQYLNINEVNKLTPEMMLPSKMSATDSCSGIVGLNLEGDTSKSADDSFDQEIPHTGGSTQLENVKPEPDKTRIDFYGGGGVGVQAAPIVGIDGSVLAVQVIHSGFGYKYPPIVNISDDTGQGGGVVARAYIKTKTSDEDVFVEEYDSEEDYEEYNLEKCAPELERLDIGYGQRWGPDGKDLGKWDPNVYLSDDKKTQDPIRYEIEKYQKYLLDLKDGSRIENGRILQWWTTRQKLPLRVTSGEKVTRDKFDVQHPAWGGMSLKSANKTENTSSTFGVATAFIESSFRVYTSGGQRRGLKFIFKGGDHRFEVRADDYKDNASPEEIKIKVRKNTKYTVTTTSKKGIRDQGLLKKGTFGTGGDIAQRAGLKENVNISGTSNAIFSDIGKTAPDDDDLQLEAKQGTFTIESKGANIIYELKDSVAYNAERDSLYWKKKKDKKISKDSFMNQFAISPIAPSNVPGSDNAGKTYTFEWEEEFPYEGEYIFNVQCDNESKLYIDNEPVDNFQIGAGGAAGHILSKPASIKRYMSVGSHKMTLDLLNHQIMEMKKIQTSVESASDVGNLGEDDVTFKVNIGTLYAAGIKLFDGNTLVFENNKAYAADSISASHTKKIEVGKVYDVEFTSSNQRDVEGGSDDGTAIGRNIEFTELNATNNPINVKNNGTRLALKDRSRDGETDASFTIKNVTGGTAKFSSDGTKINVKGTDVKIEISLSWADNPRTSGKAVGSIKIADKIWRTKGKVGSKTQTVTLSGSSTVGGTVGGNNNSAIQLRTKGKNVIQMEDIPDNFSAGTGGTNDEAYFYKDVVCTSTKGEFYNLQGRKCKYRIPFKGNLPDSSTQKGDRAHVFNTVDFIKKADRKLWKINPSAGKDADFFNRFGVLPFDPTAVAKIKKKRKKTVEIEPTGAPPRVKFEVGSDGKNYLKVMGNGRVKVGFEMNVNDNINISGLALKEVRIQADDGEILMARKEESVNVRPWMSRRRRNFIKTQTTIATISKHTGIGIFSAGKKYEIKTLGGSKTSGSIIGVDKTSIGYDDDITDVDGYDENANVRIKSITPLSSTKQIEETVMGYPDYPNASTDDYAGFHTIIWNNITFPEDGNYSIATMVDDNVVLTFSKPAQKDIVLEKKGFRIRGDGRTGTGKSVEIKYFKAGSYTLTAVLEQIPGVALAQGNPMALAVDVKASFFSNEVEVVSRQSWNQNPMGVSMTIDAPLAPPPKEPPQLQEGRCPNNPIWTTRSTTDVDKTWYPVRVDMWSKFTNRYGISPLPPLGFKGTDGAGTVFRNKWRVQLPYKGFYGVKGTVDNFGKIFIDGVEVLGPDSDRKLESYKSESPKSRKIFLEKKTVEITVELENEKQFIWNTIDQKVFSTADWASTQKNTKTEILGPQSMDVDFNLSIATMYAAGIKLFDSNTGAVVFENDKGYDKPAISASYTKNIELGKVYDVEFTSSNTDPNKNFNTNGNGGGPNGIVFTELNATNNPINVKNNGTRLALKDRSRDGETDASFTIKNVTGGTARFAPDGKSFIVKGSKVKVTLSLSWADNPRTSGKAVGSIKVGSTTWRTKGKVGSKTHTITLSDGKSGLIRNDGSNNSAVKLRNKGKNVIEMEDVPDDFSAGTGGTNDEAYFYKDIVCSATEGEFYNLQGRKCKYRIPSKDKIEIKYGIGLAGGSSKGGVSYDGPPLSTYINSQTLGPFLTPTWNTDLEYIETHNGKTWVMKWGGVDFPEKGTYDIQAEADDKLIVKIDGNSVATAEVGNGVTKTQFTVLKGKRDVELTLTNLDFNAPFSQNPAVFAVKITRKVDVAKVDPRTGTAQGKPWTVNPLGISAMLIPPPCPKKINGVGIVTDVIITDPGNGYPPILPPPIDPDTPTTSVILELQEFITEDEGINYAPEDRVCVINTETGEEVCFIPPKTPTTGIPPFKPEETPIVTDPPDPTPPKLPDPTTPPPPGEPPEGPPPGPPGLPPPPITQRKPPNGFRTYPKVVVRTRTGIGAKLIPILRPVIDPIGVIDPDRLIQVTDLPGLKQTGYYDGRPYYGAVFYENGIRYAGYYDTPGQKVQIYDTLQDSIDAEVTTLPSAIQRQGTDINSNDPRLNIPGTPDNLT